MICSKLMEKVWLIVRRASVLACQCPWASEDACPTTLMLYLSNHRINQRADLGNLDLDFIAALKCEAILGHDAGASEQKHAVREGLITKKPADQLFERALDPRDG